MNKKRKKSERKRERQEKRDREKREREKEMSCVQYDHYIDYTLPFVRIARL